MPAPQFHLLVGYRHDVSKQRILPLLQRQPVATEQPVALRQYEGHNHANRQCMDEFDPPFHLPVTFYHLQFGFYQITICDLPFSIYQKLFLGRKYTLFPPHSSSSALEKRRLRNNSVIIANKSRLIPCPEIICQNGNSRATTLLS